MKRFLLLLVFLPLAVGAADMDVYIKLNEHDIIREDFIISFESQDYFESFEFVTHEPLSVSYEGKYYIEDGSLVLMKNIVPGNNTVSFSLYFDDLVERTSSGKVFRTEFEYPGGIRLQLELPERHGLSKHPSLAPPASGISTDGRHIILEWQGQDRLVLAVFYEGGDSGPFLPVVVSILAILICVVLTYIFVSRSKARKDLTRLLSDEESDVLSHIQKKVVLQSKIASSLGFSKSKMSKVVRKLEQKGLIEKKPHLKTNILKEKRS